MKRIIAAVLIFSLLSGCGVQKSQKTSSSNRYVYGMWITAYELKNLAKTGFKENFLKLANEASDMGINTFFVHTTAFCDSLYDSDYFKKVPWCENEEYDVMSFIAETLKNKGIEFHAWINPYRISHSKNADIPFGISEFEEGKDYLRLENGVYLSPSSVNVRRHIIKAIKELVLKYDIDGVHFDDYFYPTTDKEFDGCFYGEYSSKTEHPVSLDEFRRIQVNMLISGVSQTLKAVKKDVKFTVSPAADIEKNYNSLYADVAFWCKSGFIDAVIPQLYFGFEYPIEKYSFENLVLEWIKLTEKSNVSLYAGLAPYKLGITAENDKAEWENGVDIVARQIRYSRTKPEINGISLFSFSSLFAESEKNKIQAEFIKSEILKGEPL